VGPDFGENWHRFSSEPNYEGEWMSGLRKLPPFEQSIAAIMLNAKEAVLAPMRPKLREHYITEPQWRVMRVLNDRGATDATCLSDVALLHAPSVTRILKDLEERKLVVREPDRHDGRRTLVTLTPAGRDIVKVISKDVLRIWREYSERFGAERLERLTDELNALSAAIKGVE
jgi:homoprotocatechuate degradation regulator HpaR